MKQFYTAIDSLSVDNAKLAVAILKIAKQSGIFFILTVYWEGIQFTCSDDFTQYHSSASFMSVIRFISSSENTIRDL
jgi:hypothetical protein